MASLIPDDNGLWRVEFTGMDGARKRVRLGRMTEKFANRFKHSLERLLDEMAIGGVMSVNSSNWLQALPDRLYGRLAAKLPIDRRVSMTLAAWQSHFMLIRKALEQSSKTKLEQTFTKLIEFFTASKLLRDITQSDAQAWRNWMVEKVSDRTGKHISRATVRTHVGNAKAIFGRAVKERMINESPFRDEHGGTTPSENLKFVSWQSIEKVLHYIKNPDLRLLVALCRYAGLRAGCEPSRLLWSKHVDLEKRRLLVPCKKTERYAGKALRRVAIDERLLAHLSLKFQNKAADEDRVCRLDRLSGTHCRTVRRAIRRAGVSSWPKLFQGLRVSFDSELRNHGIHTDFAGKMTGHSAKISQDSYTAVPEETFEFAERLYSADEVKAAQKAAHLGAESNGTSGNAKVRGNRKTLKIQSFSDRKGTIRNRSEVGAKGLEPFAYGGNSSEITGILKSGGAKSGALDRQLRELLTLWPRLTAADRAAVLALAWAKASVADGDRQGTAGSRTSSTSSAVSGSTQCRAGRGAASGRRAPGGLHRRSGRTSSQPILEKNHE